MSEFPYLAIFISFVRTDSKGTQTVIWRTAAKLKVAVAFWRIIIEAGILMFFL